MISMVESAKRQKTPNERALEILLVGLTVLFIVVVATLYPLPRNHRQYHCTGARGPFRLPHTDNNRRTVARHRDRGDGPSHPAQCHRLEGRAVEASGDVNVVLLDKTGTITLGNRMATDFITASGVSSEELMEAALLASLADETPEGRSIVALAKHHLSVRAVISKPRGCYLRSFHT